ncbi:MAG: BREX system ATP-binding domain-containing protein [Candidatus Hodarchaeota archaeon]
MMFKANSSKLAQEDAVSIIEALETGLPPEARYLPYIFTGREELLVSLLKGLSQVTKQHQRMVFAFLEGTRGRGKTFLARLVIELVRRGRTNLKEVIPVYLNLKESQGATDFIQDLFYSLFIGLSQNILIEEKLKIYLRMIINEFAMDLNLYRLRPQETALPFRQIQALLDIAADQGMSIILFLDEIDTITVNINKTNQIFEILGVAYDTPRVRIGWVFLGSRSSFTAFKERVSGGCQFASRIFQSEERHLKFALEPFTNQEKKKLILTIKNVFYKAKAHPSLPNLNDAHIRALELSMEPLVNPREITAYIVSKLYALESLTPVMQTAAQRSAYPPLVQGTTIDRELKEKILPFLSVVIDGVKYRKNPPDYPSIRKLGENRRVDGEIELEDGFLVGLETKYSDKSATLSMDQLDQMAAYLKGNEHLGKKCQGIFFLFGKFSGEDPLDREGRTWLEQLHLSDQIHFFSVSNPLFLNELNNIVNGARLINDEAPLRGACSWLITFLQCEHLLRTLALEHLDRTRPPVPIPDVVTVLPSLSTAQVTSGSPIPTKGSLVSPSPHQQKDIELKPATIKGLGKIRIDRLKQNNINTLRELIRYNKDEIARMTGAKPGQAGDWLEQAHRLLV